MPFINEFSFVAEALSLHLYNAKLHHRVRISKYSPTFFSTSGSSQNYSEDGEDFAAVGEGIAHAVGERFDIGKIVHYHRINMAYQTSAFAYGRWRHKAESRHTIAIFTHSALA